MTISPERGTQSSYWDWIVVEHCCVCGIPFGMPQKFKNECLKRKNDKEFYCPSGHKQWYVGKTEADILKGQLEAERIRSQTWREEAQKEKLRTAATKGALTKVKKRIANGVCPCCNRSFENLARHMAGKHPEYKRKLK